MGVAPDDPIRALAFPPHEGGGNTETRHLTARMLDGLAAEHSVSRQAAYMLCSLAGDLKILEVVDAGMCNVGITIPRSIFKQ